MKTSEGNDLMIEIAQAVREGAMAYLSRQYRIVTMVFVVLFVILIVMSFAGLQSFIVPFAFVTGGFFSGVCGYIGMKTATNASARTANAARTSLNSGLQVAFRAGAVMGLSVVGFALLDSTLWFLLLYFVFQTALPLLTVIMLSAAMGASTQALFARVGGGIYTKAADVGADLVGKVEAGIPEDDPRNPATIADNVGDNVGDVAGMGADLYESYVGSLRAAAALGVATAISIHGVDAIGEQLKYITAPLAIASIGVLLSVVGIFLVRTEENASMGQLMGALTRSITISSVLIAVASLGIIFLLNMPFSLWIAIVTGLVVGEVIGRATEYYTSDEYGPTKSIAAQGETGPATVIIGGLAVGMRSTAIPVLVVIIGIVVSFY
jgi:K(+)-stimulated pyrophosphate-energized sodium pump